MKIDRIKKMLKATFGIVASVIFGCLFAVGCASEGTKEKLLSKDGIAILAIGNSFSDNAMKYMPQILEAFGAENITLGNLYIGGCTLETHANNARSDLPAYEYRINTPKGLFGSRPGMKMSDALGQADWDVITLQQASGVSGMIDTYNEDLDYLIEYVKANKKETARLAWHMTWAYQSDSSHDEFVNYGNSQRTMYEKIVACVEAKIDANANFDFVIPAGTAIQNARTGYAGDALTKDGYHLNSLGEFIAGVTWVLKITGWNIDELNFEHDKIPAELRPHADLIRESAVNALARPYGVTDSELTENPA